MAPAAFSLSNCTAGSKDMANQNLSHDNSSMEMSTEDLVALKRQQPRCGSPTSKYMSANLPSKLVPLTSLADDSSLAMSLSLMSLSTSDSLAKPESGKQSRPPRSALNMFLPASSKVDPDAPPKFIKRRPKTSCLLKIPRPKKRPALSTAKANVSPDPAASGSADNPAAGETEQPEAPPLRKAAFTFPPGFLKMVGPDLPAQTAQAQSIAKEPATATTVSELETAPEVAKTPVAIKEPEKAAYSANVDEAANVSGLAEIVQEPDAGRATMMEQPESQEITENPDTGTGAASFTMPPKRVASIFAPGCLTILPPGPPTGLSEVKQAEAKPAKDKDVAEAPKPPPKRTRIFAPGCPNITTPERPPELKPTAPTAVVAQPQQPQPRKAAVTFAPGCLKIVPVSSPAKAESAGVKLSPPTTASTPNVPPMCVNMAVLDRQNAASGSDKENMAPASKRVWKTASSGYVAKKTEKPAVKVLADKEVATPESAKPKRQSTTAGVGKENANPKLAAKTSADKVAVRRVSRPWTLKKQSLLSEADKPETPAEAPAERSSERPALAVKAVQQSKSVQADQAKPTRTTKPDKAVPSVSRQFCVWRDGKEQPQDQQRRERDWICPSTLPDPLFTVPDTMTVQHKPPGRGFVALVRRMQLLTIHDQDTGIVGPTQVNGDAKAAAAASNPFAAAFQQQQQQQQQQQIPPPAFANPFAAKAPSQLAAASSAPSIFARGGSPVTTDSAAAVNPFQAALKKTPAFGQTSSQSQAVPTFGLTSQTQAAPAFGHTSQTLASNPFQKAATQPAAVFSGAPKTNGTTSTTFGQAKKTVHFDVQETPLTQPQTEYARRIYVQLEKDKIRPPQWPTDAGDPAKRSVMETFRESYKKYRERVRASLVKGGLIDDPDVRKRLDEAIDFKGICEEMCPEFEKMSRMVQYDVKMAEKTEGPDGTMWAAPELMVKALARSAAGQEAPLPMDVRSVGALKRTLDYLVDTVLGDDSRLATTHNFLWDRTRAIRRDFVFHSSMTASEMGEQVYCLETITRFHATALHQLSRRGFAAEDFSEQQEREQLGKALLSLMQAYDDCREREVTCSHEAEFRAYFVLLNAHDPDFQHKVTEWGAGLWRGSDEIQTALTLVEAMQSVWDWRGPVRPAMPTTLALGAGSVFFRIVASAQVSYTMACLAEIHFVHVRRGILRNVVRAYARTRDSPRDLTVAVLNEMLWFDSDDEAREFVTAHGLSFSAGAGASDPPHLLLQDRTGAATQVGSPTVRQSFSHKLVERKRGGRSLPELIHTTVLEEGGVEDVGGSMDINDTSNDTNSIFVDQSPTPPSTEDSASVLAPFATASTPFAVSSTPFGTTPTKPVASVFAPKPVSAPSIFGAAASPFATNNSGSQTAPSPFQSNLPPPPAARSTTPTGSPTRPTEPAMPPRSIFDQLPAQPASTLFSQAPPKPEAPAPATVFQPAPTPAPASSFSSLFPSAVTNTTAMTAPTAPTAAPAAHFPTKTAEDVPNQASKSTTPEATPPSSFMSAPKLPPPQTSVAPTAPTAPTAPAPVMDPLGDFTKWFVLGDDGMLDEFKEALVEHLVRQTVEQYRRDEEERQRQEEDAQSWVEALRFKKYNLRVKFFYRWRDTARERALDRRARQSRDQMKAYQEAKRAEQRAAAEKAAAEKRERAAEARRRSSREVKFLEELGYYSEMAASSRKRKAVAAGEGVTEPEATRHDGADALLATGVLRGVHDEQAAASRVVREASALMLGKRGRTSLDSVHSIGSIGSSDSLDDADSTGDSIHDTANETANDAGSIRSVRSNRSDRSRDDGSSKFVYYRRSVPGRGRVQSIFTRVTPRAVEKDRTGRGLSPSPSSAGRKPGKMTNFMRYDNKKRWSWSSSMPPGGRGSGDRGSPTPSQSLSQSQSFSMSTSAAGTATGLGLGSGSGSGSRVRSSYWRLRAMGLVQMPNGQYLHESLALPMLQDGRRFRGVGSYGMPSVPPVPTPSWDDDGKGRSSSRRRSEDDPPLPPPAAKKARTQDGIPATEAGPTTAATAATASTALDLHETERVIREMRELADAMDQDRDWFREQTELLQKGTSVWDQ
ncbi:leucine permease transcriptional regulator [Grosmannia clavigera kw1407]|uniref:Leucine permease transcriptional regulator n=1 Tax=Grosmannia clavigera (strain kw1407 / UAMH 11150) TaxID=655863 RepID=F0XRB1_GROCL|nr:leucine permease transcriptional regulator [Grosmannia clavigera kw1407]EFW99988.1 leucine permease transcriptional regulator [Grosmannia clavigera kw1407]